MTHDTDRTEDSSDQFEDIAEAIRDLSTRQLRGFTASEGASSTRPGGLEHSWRFGPEAVASTSVMELLFKVVVRAQEFQTFDRFGWDFGFQYLETRCRLRWQKSGLKLSFWLPEEDDVQAERFGMDVERRLTKAAAIVYRRAIRARVEEELANNRVAVVNQYVRYRGMVDYFISQIENNRAAGPSATRTEPSEEPSEDFSGQVDVDIAEIVRNVVSNVKHDREIGYLAIALVAGYFAYIQHVLVGLSAFSPRALDAQFSVRELMASSWAEQFDFAFPTPQHGDIGRAKSGLHKIADHYRNPILHGGGGRPADGMFVQWAAGRSILVTEDSEPSSLFMLWRPAISQSDIEEILSEIAKIDRALESHPYFPWVAAGLAADFRPEAIRRSIEALAGGWAPEYVAASNEMFDREVNWD